MDNKHFVGKPLKAKEDLRLVSGWGEFADDVRISNSLYTSFLRSTYAHARIKRIDTSKARSVEGVVDILTAADLRQIIEPVSGGSLTIIPGKMSIRKIDYIGLAENKVNYVGEPIVAVLARTRSACDDAIEKIVVDYEPLQAVVDPEEALKPGGPLLYESWGDNILYTLKLEEGEAEKAIESSPVVVRRRFAIPRLTVVSIEPRCSTAHYDSGRGVLTVWSSTQRPHIERSVLAKTLRMPENRVRVIAKDVGGGFGLKTSTFIETITSAIFAVRHGIAVKWTETRSESISTFHAREQVHYVEVGVDRDGHILAFKDRVIANFGAFYPTAGVKSILNTAVFLLGCYRIAKCSIDLTCTVTNKAPYTAYRGFGKAEASYVIERTINAIAKELGLDPLTVRLRNLIPKESLPYRSITGVRYDSGDYEKSLRMALEFIQYEKARSKQRELRKQGKMVGIGFGVSLAPGGAVNPESLHSGYEAAHIKIAPDGSITVLSGVSSQGQTHETPLAQVVADELGVEESWIRVVEGDTDLCPYGLGAWSDRTSVKGLPAAMVTSRILKEKLAAAAEQLLKVPKENLVFDSGQIYSRDDKVKSIPFKELVWRIYTQPYLFEEIMDPGLEAVHYIKTENVKYVPDEKGIFSLYPIFAYCACAVVLEVDPETGSVRFDKVAIVDDAGTIANPLIVEAQLQGGATQGLGSAMLEEIKYDSDGQIIGNTLMDYLIPTSTYVPKYKLGRLETPSPFVLGGFKSVGETGTIGLPPAIANAVEDALAASGISAPDPPFTEEKLHKVIHGKH